MLLLLGCSGTADGTDASGVLDTAPDDTGPGETAPVDTADPCADAQPMTWENFGEGFLIGACNGCHGAAADDRHDAPEDVVFDTREQAWAWAARILARAASVPPTMPPSGGVEDDDRVRLTWWLACGEPGS